MTTSHSPDFGSVTDYRTGDFIRPATAGEWRMTADTINAADTDRPDGYTGAWADSDGRAVWVDGGPDVGVTEDDVQQLLTEAASAGDLEQVALCGLSLADDGTEGSLKASQQCVRVILDHRQEVA